MAKHLLRARIPHRHRPSRPLARASGGPSPSRGTLPSIAGLLPLCSPDDATAGRWGEGGECLTLSEILRIVPTHQPLLDLHPLFLPSKNARAQVLLYLRLRMSESQTVLAPCMLCVAKNCQKRSISMYTNKLSLQHIISYLEVLEGWLATLVGLSVLRHLETCLRSPSV